MMDDDMVALPGGAFRRGSDAFSAEEMVNQVRWLDESWSRRP